MKPRCQHCGSKGGKRTVELYGREYMSKLGKLGGRPKLRQLSAPQVESKNNGGKRLPNRLSELKELYKLQIKEGRGCLACQGQGAKQPLPEGD